MPLSALVPYFSVEWKARYGGILHAEHIDKIANHLRGHRQGSPILAFSHFIQQSPPDTSSLDLFLQILHAAPLPQVAAQQLEAIAFRHWLRALGQRCTSGSLTNEQAIPLPAATLLQNCQKPYNTEVSVALRAWEKHVSRTDDTFWGIIKGNPAQKEPLVQERIVYILEHTAWWNVFEHPKHGFVYEIREPQGHGIRWQQTTGMFIGFLEPLGDFI